MPDGETPSMAEIARRLQRVEDKLDERIATTDMLRATERLFEAREIAHSAALSTMETRVNKLESANAALSRLVIAAFLGLLVQAIILIFTLSSRGGT
jgi:hypothetical protein